MIKNNGITPFNLVAIPPECSEGRNLFTRLKGTISNNKIKLTYYKPLRLAIEKNPHPVFSEWGYQLG